ncbi:MAG: ribonuclease PH [Thermoanaerobaculia bacterium]|nr:ribonuclease PH [Thermoanaerobaculia bacterium]
MSRGTFQRSGGRRPNQMRPASIETGVMKFAEGSALIAMGDTRVLVTGSVERRVPRFLDETVSGWLTAEYAMLPRATHTRSQREVSRGRPSGRSSEIQRLIGRSLRAVIDLHAMPGWTLTVDCDVLQADGGTRTASITAGYVAAVQALAQVYLAGDLRRWPVKDALASISIGIVEGTPCLDLEYTEDSRADVDLNLVATGAGHLVEIQGTGEGTTFSRQELDALVDLGFEGIEQLIAIQEQVLAPIVADVETVDGTPRRSAEPKDEADLWGDPSDL